MPIFIKDYLKDTMGITHSQRGAYLLAMIAYWVKGEALSPWELHEASKREFNRVQKFFVLEGGRWHHERLDCELKRARERQEWVVERARRAAEARWSKP